MAFSLTLIYDYKRLNLTDYEHNKSFLYNLREPLLYDLRI